MISIITLITTVVMYMCGGQIDTVSVYPQCFAVVEVDAEADIVTCIDMDGEEWSFNGVEDYQRGDLVSAIMTDMGTPTYIYDDEFISVEFSGRVHDTFGWDSEVNMPLVDFSERD